MSKRLRIILTVAVLSILLYPLGMVPTAEAAKTYEFNISLDSPATHGKTLGTQVFVEELVKRSEGRLKPTIYHSSQLYTDPHAIKALLMGTLDMAIIGNHLLDGVDINTTVTHLPMFFGRSLPEDEYWKMLDELSGPIGKRLEKKLNVKMIGRPYALGFDHMYTSNREITKLEDFKGLKIRIPGGAVALARLRSLGAGGVLIAYADVAVALTQHTIDGASTTTMSVEKAKLDEAGLKYCVETRNYFTHYFPMVSNKFWNSLPADLQKIFVESYEYSVPKQRVIAHKEQQDAKEALQKRGMKFYTPTAKQAAEWRDKFMLVQADLIRDLKYDPELIKICEAALSKVKE